MNLIREEDHMLNKKDVIEAINAFTMIAINENLIQPLDRFYVTNRLFSYLDIIDGEQLEITDLDYNLLNQMDKIVEYAISNDIISSLSYEREQFEAKIMDLITPIPSVVNQNFWKLYENDKKSATDYFYRLSQMNDYIKTRNIARNIAFTSESKYGQLQITINLSKPEKTPKDIEFANNAPATNYPKCVLCMENEGYQGHSNHAARQNHRLIRMEIAGEMFGFQYSPYVYYNEHSIFLKEKHTPMEINRQTFANLFEILEILSHYFIGSNTDLPGVGGSILAHDHYQGGRHHFPIEDAKAYADIHLDHHPNVKAELLEWPMTVIRLKSDSSESLSDAAETILNAWRTYSDETVDIISNSNEEQHNTVTPIARKKENSYELDVVLRNNRKSAEFPDGIFHPHQDVQHIKQENIGLIEVMGLAILPPRLENEIKEVKQFLNNEIQLDAVNPIHQAWAEDLKEEMTSNESIDGIINTSIGRKFVRILEDAGVYKNTDEGRSALLRFIDTVNAN